MMNTIMEEDDEASEVNLQGRTEGTAIRSGLRDLDDDDEEDMPDTANKLKYEYELKRKRLPHEGYIEGQHIDPYEDEEHEQADPVLIPRK